MSIVKHEWWSTPIWEIQTYFDSEFNDKLLVEMESIPQEQLQIYGNIWQLDLPNINILRSYIESTMKSQIHENLFIDNGWFYSQQYGKGLVLHDHHGAFLIAIYYVSVPSDSGNLLLADPRGGVRWFNDPYDDSYTAKVKGVIPASGKLVFFPGYVLHMVEPCLNDIGTRVSVVSNIGFPGN